MVFGVQWFQFGKKELNSLIGGKANFGLFDSVPRRD
jgi:hypothetical protein